MVFTLRLSNWNGQITTIKGSTDSGMGTGEREFSPHFNCDYSII